MRRNQTLSVTEHDRAVAAGKRWPAFDAVAEARADYEGFRWSGRRLPALHLEDVSHIPFVADIPGVELYQHRARVRSHTGDLFAAVTPVSEGYEDYCQDYLHLENPDMVLAEPVNGLLAVSQACAAGEAYDAIARWARNHGEVLLHPYMSISDVWELAKTLREREGVHVEVVGPNPEPLWVANDKASLTEIIRLVLDDRWVVETKTSTSIETLAETLMAFAKKYEFVGLKRTRCASAMGNAVYRSSEIQQKSHADLTAMIRDFLTDTQWEGDEEVLVVEWVDTDISPSTQIWIPPEGLPVLEGVYEQLLEGEEKCFLGSRPSTLPEPVNTAIGDASLAISAVFQSLGYTGRCSFDFIVDGDLDGEFHARFTECNGRWGGTSTPMYLTDRLMRDRPHYIAQDYKDSNLAGAEFNDLVKGLASHLWRAETGEGRFILYNVGPLKNDGKFDVISIGQNPEEAWEGVLEIIPRALGL